MKDMTSSLGYQLEAPKVGSDTMAMFQKNSSPLMTDDGWWVKCPIESNLEINSGGKFMNISNVAGSSLCVNTFPFAFRISHSIFHSEESWNNQLNQWIGLGEHLPENPTNLMVKTMGFLKFSLWKPLHWNKKMPTFRDIFRLLFVDRQELVRQAKRSWAFSTWPTTLMLGSHI